LAPNPFQRYDSDTVERPNDVRERTMAFLKSRSYMKPDERSAEALSSWLAPPRSKAHWPLPPA